MTLSAPPLSESQYDRMASELQTMSDSIRARPEMNHHFAERLALLAQQMREDCRREHPPEKVLA
jgi:hypothetical protein